MANNHTLSGSHPNSLLYVMDAQKGVATDECACGAITRIQMLLKQPSLPVAFSYFQNFKGSPFCRFLKWPDMMTEDECKLVYTGDGPVFRKQGYSGVRQEFREHHRQSGIEVVYLCGVDTDCCVAVTAADLFVLGIRPVVLADYCGSNGGVASHEAGLLALTRLIGEAQIIHGSVDTPMLASKVWN